VVPVARCMLLRSWSWGSGSLFGVKDARVVVSIRLVSVDWKIGSLLFGCEVIGLVRPKRLLVVESGKRREGGIVLYTKKLLC
jgi:hypothetical protein